MEKKVAFDLLSVGKPRRWLLKTWGICAAIYAAAGRTGGRDFDLFYEAGIALLPKGGDERRVFECVEALREHAAEWDRHPEQGEEMRKALQARKARRQHLLGRVRNDERDSAIRAVAREFDIRPHAVGAVYSPEEKRRRKAALNAACALVESRDDWAGIGRMQVSNILYGLKKSATEKDFQEAGKRFCHYPPEQTRWRNRVRGRFAKPVEMKPWTVGLLPRGEHVDLIRAAHAGDPAARNELIARDLDTFTPGMRRRVSDPQSREDWEAAVADWESRREERERFAYVFDRGPGEPSPIDLRPPPFTEKIRRFGLAGPYEDITRHDLFEGYRTLSGLGVYANWLEIARLFRREATIDWEKRRIVLGRPSSSLAPTYVPHKALEEREKVISSFPPRLVAALERAKTGEGFCPRCPPSLRSYGGPAGALVVRDPALRDPLCVYHTLERAAIIKRRRTQQEDIAAAREMMSA